MFRMTKRRNTSVCKKALDSCLAVLLSIMLAFSALPAEAIAEASDELLGNDEATLAEVLEDLEIEESVDDVDELDAAGDELAASLNGEDVAVSDEEQAVAEAQATDDDPSEAEPEADVVDVDDSDIANAAADDEVAVAPVADDNAGASAGTDVAEPELTAQASPAYTVVFKANGGTGSMAEQTAVRDVATALAANAFVREGYAFVGWNTKANGSGTSYTNKQQVKNLAKADGTVTLYAQWEKLAEQIELTAQASGTTQTITKAGFTVPLPKSWTGKVTHSTSTLSGYNVGTLTNINMTTGNGLVIIHCAKRSEFKRVTGWGDVCLIGTKTGTDYVVEVYMTYWPWMEASVSAGGLGSSSSTTMSNARAALSLLTGGAYTTCGGENSASYEASFNAAKQYVKSNILNRLTVRGTNKWVQSGDRWWYSLADGTYPKSTFRKISGATYYFDASGWMVTGWKKISGSWYYFYSDGKMARSAWIQSGSSWYRIDKNGKMVTGLRTVGKEKYYFDKSGVMVTGWKEISKKWYYFDSSGAMVKNAWVGNYYLQADGTMATNKWIGRYHVNASGLWDMTK